MNRGGVLKVVPEKWRNHLVMLGRYWTLRKVLNAGRALYGYLAARERLATYPVFVKVEASNRCGVQCKYCYARKSGQLFPFERFATLVDRLSPYAFEVSLHDIGEPLLHDRILDFIAYAHSRRVGTLMSSTLAVRKDDAFWRGLVVGGLDRLVVAIDGLSPSTYNQYRTHADLSLVMANLERILGHRRAARSALRVTWQMLDLPWNRHEQRAAKARARDLGCDSFSLIHEESLPRRRYFEHPVVRSRNCWMPYLMLVVTAEGKVRPCCNLYGGLTESITHDNVVGDLTAESFESAWNSAAMRQIRSRQRISDRAYCRACQEM